MAGGASSCVSRVGTHYFDNGAREEATYCAKRGRVLLRGGGRWRGEGGGSRQGKLYSVFRLRVEKHGRLISCPILLLKKRTWVFCESEGLRFEPRPSVVL